MCNAFSIQRYLSAVASWHLTAAHWERLYHVRITPLSVLWLSAQPSSEAPHTSTAHALWSSWVYLRAGSPRGAECVILAVKTRGWKKRVLGGEIRCDCVGEGFFEDLVPGWPQTLGWRCAKVCWPAWANPKALLFLLPLPPLWPSLAAELGREILTSNPEYLADSDFPL